MLKGLILLGVLSGGRDRKVASQLGFKICSHHAQKKMHKNTKSRRAHGTSKPLHLGTEAIL